MADAVGGEHLGAAAGAGPVVPVPQNGAVAAGASAPTLGQRLEGAVANLVVLRVTTVVGTVSAQGADDLHQVTRLTLAADGQHVASTSINMMLGDSSTILSPAFVENPAYKELHMDSVKKAQEVRDQTINLLEKAFATLKEYLHL